MKLVTKPGVVWRHENGRRGDILPNSEWDNVYNIFTTMTFYNSLFSSVSNLKRAPRDVTISPDLAAGERVAAAFQFSFVCVEWWNISLISSGFTLLRSTPWGGRRRGPFPCEYRLVGEMDDDRSLYFLCENGKCFGGRETGIPGHGWRLPKMSITPCLSIFKPLVTPLA